MQFSPRFARQVGEQLFGETAARLTVAGGVGRTRLSVPRRAVGQHATDGVAA